MTFPEWIDSIRFAASRRDPATITIAETPSLDPDSLEFYGSSLSACRKYLEYGSGASTRWAAARGVPFVTVESDPVFLTAVRREIPAPPAGSHLLHVDIGAVGPWGTPIVRLHTPGRYRRWQQYAEAPWTLLTEDPPDLVLVDGRFRVNCALVSLLHLGPASTATILVDDYTGRPSYAQLEAFLTLERTVGRMAVFRPKKNDPERLYAAIRESVWDWR